MSGHPRPVPFPTRGVPGGWRDERDDPLDVDALRAEAEAASARLEAGVLATRRRLDAEKKRTERQRRRRRRS